jgi:hypothetical protein
LPRGDCATAGNGGNKENSRKKKTAPAGMPALYLMCARIDGMASIMTPCRPEWHHSETIQLDMPSCWRRFSKYDPDSSGFDPVHGQDVFDP